MESRPKEAAERLLNELLPFAKKMVKEHGEFHPFCAHMKPDGSIVHMAAQVPGNDHPPAMLLIRTLRASLRELISMKECIGTALVFNVEVTSPRSARKTEAIQVNLDHVAGYSAEVFCPYQRDKDGNVSFGDLFAQHGASDMFGRDTTTQ